MNATEITREIAAKVLTIVDAGLVSGLGEAKPGEMCVEAAVCYALGLPHGDDPGCVSMAIRALKIRLNDFQWSSADARARGLRRLALAQLGSKGVIDDIEFAGRVAEAAIRGPVARALRAVARLHEDPKHRQALTDAAARCEAEGTHESALNAKRTADAAYYAAAAAKAASAADAAYYAAAAKAAYAANAKAANAKAADAAYYAAAKAADAAAAADAASARDHELATFAEEVVQVLIGMNAPGCQWLDMAPLAIAA